MAILDFFRRKTEEEKEKARRLAQKAAASFSELKEKVRPKIDIIRNTQKQVGDWVEGKDDEYKSLEKYFKGETSTIYKQMEAATTAWKKKQIDAKTLDSTRANLDKKLNILVGSDDKLKEYYKRREEIQFNVGLNAMTLSGVKSKIAGKALKYVSKIAKSKVSDDIVRFLGKFKVDKIVAEELAPKLAKITDEQLIYRMTKTGQAITAIEKKVGYLGKDIRGNISLAVDRIVKTHTSASSENAALKNLSKEISKSILEKSSIPVINQEKNLLKVLNKNIDNIHEFSVKGGDITDYGRAKDIITKLGDGKPVHPDDTRFAFELLKKLEVDNLAKKEIAIKGSMTAEKEATEAAARQVAKERAAEDLRQQMPDLLKEAGIDAPKPLQEGVTKVAKKEALGVVGGVEVEDGKVKFSPEKAALGVAGIKASKAKTTKKIIKKAVEAGKKIVKKEVKDKKVLKSIKKEITEKVSKAVKRPINEARKQIGFQLKEKNISKETARRVAKNIGVKEWKNATKEQVEKVLQRLKTFKEGDKLPTEKSMAGLKALYPEKDLAGKTVREISEELGAGLDPLRKGIKNLISLVEPIARTKRVRGDVFKRVIDNVQYGEQASFIRKKIFADTFDKNLKLAYKSKGLLTSKKKVWTNIFNYLDTGKGKLTEGEQKLADFMKRYFKNAKEYLVNNGDMARGRAFYVPHRAAELTELIKDNGLLSGINKWNKNRKFSTSGAAGLPADIWVNLDNIMGTNKFFKFALERKGVLSTSKNVERIFKEYMSLFESKKFLDNVLPQIHAASNVLTPPSSNSAKWLQQYGKQLKGRQYGIFANAVDKVVSLNYFLKLAFSVPSAVKNMVGGEINNLIVNGFFKLMKGKERLATRPFKAYNIATKYGFLTGDYVDIARQGVISKAGKAATTAGFIPQKLAEMEIRTSQVAGLLTHKEFKTGILSRNRILEIMDNIESTQGVFTAARSPLAVKTPYGRAALQFSRWIITDTDMSTRIVKGAFKGTEKLKNQARLVRRLTAYVAGGYMAVELDKAGYDNAKKYAEVIQEPINATIKALNGELATQAVAENPSLQLISELNYSLKWVSWKMGVGDMPQVIEVKKGITETFLAPERQLEALGLNEADTAFGVFKQLKKMKPAEANKALKNIKDKDPARYTLIKKYVKWDKLKLTGKERDFAKMGVKNGMRAKQLNKYIKRQKKPNLMYKRLKEAGIITNQVDKQLRELNK